MLAWHLGTRYLRRRRAAWLALAAIVLTVAVPVFALGIMDGFVRVLRVQVRAAESDLTCTPWDETGIVDTPGRRAAITGVPGVQAVAPFVTTYALLSSGPDGQPARGGIPTQLEGVDWDADVGLGRLASGMLHPAPVVDLNGPPLPAAGRGTGVLSDEWRGRLALCGLDAIGIATLPLPPTPRPLPGVAIGRELGYVQGLLPSTQDRPARVLLQGQDGRAMARIADTIATGVYEIDRVATVVPLAVAQEVAGYAGRNGRPPRIDGYRVRVDEHAALTEVQRAVALATGMRVQTWMDRRGNIVRSVAQQRTLFVILMLAIQVIAVFVVYAVFSTLVAEKRHDIGVLLGIGLRRGTIVGAFLLAGLAACLGGGLFGWGLGWAALAGLNPFCKALGIQLFPVDVFYSPVTPISFDPAYPVLFIGAMTAIGLLAAAIPAWRAGRIDPIQILRESA